jgi:hypothetical protein
MRASSAGAEGLGRFIDRSLQPVRCSAHKRLYPDQRLEISVSYSIEQKQAQTCIAITLKSKVG